MLLRLAMEIRWLKRNLPMPLFCHSSPDDKSHLCLVGPFIEKIAPHGDDLLACGLGHGADNGHVLAVVDIDEILDLPVSEALLPAHEAVVDGLLGQVVQ